MFRFIIVHYCTLLKSEVKAVEYWKALKQRSWRRRCSVNKAFLCQNLYFNRVACLRPTTLLKKSLCHRCFPVNFVKFLRTIFLENTSRRPLLEIYGNIDTSCVEYKLTRQWLLKHLFSCS